MKIKEITSQSNEKIKWLKKLSQKKYRQQEREFTVENLTTIYDALKSGYDFKGLYVTEEFITRNGEKFDYIKNHSKLGEYYLIDESLNKYYSQLDTPSGITAVYQESLSKIDDCKSVIYLNGINDPGNLGTIMRSALAFNVTNIVCDATCVDIYNHKVINAAKDAIFKLNIVENQEVQWLKERSSELKIYVAQAREGVTLSEIKEYKRFCLVLGNESHGISNEILKLADTSIRIDISDQIDSLNVSSAAAILLHGLSKSNG